MLVSTVVLASMAMAVDVGRIYAITGEVQTVADSTAMAAATRLIGTTNSSGNAVISGFAPLDTTTGNDNRFNIHTTTVAGSNDLAVSMNIDYFNLLSDAKTAS